MVNVSDISHPGVEFPLPFDGETERFLVPENTTLFFWAAIGLGTKDRIAPADTDRGARQHAALDAAKLRINISLSIDDESVWLQENVYKMGGYRGSMWWIACLPETVPATVTATIETTGDRPTIDGDPAVIWTNNGDIVPWGTEVKSTLKLSPSSASASQFPMKQDNLWGRHSVYMPVRRLD